MLAPIVIFAFNRPEALSKLIESLKRCPLYEQSVKIVFIDGCRNNEDHNKVLAVKRIAETITTNVRVSTQNKGLATSIISGITEVIHQYGKVIVLEDDLIVASGFLLYMNKALTVFENDNRIISVCGYGLKIKKPQKYKGDVYLSNRSSSWGWGTWANRWRSIDWDVRDFNQLQNNRKLRHDFNCAGSDMYGMLLGYMKGENNSWAIRFCYSMFRQGKYSIHPFCSLVDNLGYGSNATNCKQRYSRFKIDDCMFSNQDLFTFSNINHQQDDYMKLDKMGGCYMPFDIKPEKHIIEQLRRYHSIPIRIYSKVRKILNI